MNFVDRYTYRFEEQVLPIARKHGVGIVAMKVFGGAKNGQYAKPQLGSQLDPQYLEMAVRYAMGVPGVATLNLGAANPEQIPKNVAMVLGSRPLVADEQARLDALGREFGPAMGQTLWPAGDGCRAAVWPRLIAVNMPCRPLAPPSGSGRRDPASSAAGHPKPAVPGSHPVPWQWHRPTATPGPTRWPSGRRRPSCCLTAPCQPSLSLQLLRMAFTRSTCSWS